MQRVDVEAQTVESHPFEGHADQKHQASNLIIECIAYILRTKDEQKYARMPQLLEKWFGKEEMLYDELVRMHYGKRFP